ncbi:hypothetical protein AAFP30_19545 [Gordonia sp. CPCC 205515]|uniref:hypothetical protein n=1 Tax=Gordonia sp. CPCC 205515 TaxID=3140791 RepID=UPI003AF3FB2B
MPEEPSILASLGVDPGTLTPPPPEIWQAALHAAFDPTAIADADTVPVMDDTPASGDDQVIADDPTADVAHGQPPHGDVPGHDTVLVDDDHDDIHPGHTDTLHHDVDEFGHHDDYGHDHDGHDDIGGHHGL